MPYFPHFDVDAPHFLFFHACRLPDPTHVDATNNLAYGLSVLGPLDRAQSMASFGLSSSGTEYRAGGADDMVTEDVILALYRRVVELNPSHRTGLNNMGLSLLKQGHAVEVGGRSWCQEQSSLDCK